MTDVTLHVVECAFGKVRYLREMDLAERAIDHVQGDVRHRPQLPVRGLRRTFLPLLRLE